MLQSTWRLFVAASILTVLFMTVQGSLRLKGRTLVGTGFVTQNIWAMLGRGEIDPPFPAYFNSEFQLVTFNNDLEGSVATDLEKTDSSLKTTTRAPQITEMVYPSFVNGYQSVVGIDGIFITFPPGIMDFIRFSHINGTARTCWNMCVRQMDPICAAIYWSGSHNPGSGFCYLIDANIPDIFHVIYTRVPGIAMWGLDRYSWEYMSNTQLEVSSTQRMKVADRSLGEDYYYPPECHNLCRIHPACGAGTSFDNGTCVLYLRNAALARPVPVYSPQSVSFICTEGLWQVLSVDSSPICAKAANVRELTVSLKTRIDIKQFLIRTKFSPLPPLLD